MIMVRSHGQSDWGVPLFGRDTAEVADLVALLQG